ncbi:MAG: phasin family protein [Actinomycetota bacterium]|nr:phasin family protein [Actinomycetota bacterium]
MRDELKRFALFGSGVAELTRYRAEQMVKELVKAGDVRREQASGVVKDLVERSRQNRAELTSMVQAEFKNQVKNLGLATKRDVERLERRVERLETRIKELRDAGTAPKKPTSTRTSKKSTAKKSPTKATRSTRPAANSDGHNGSQP